MKYVDGRLQFNIFPKKCGSKTYLEVFSKVNNDIRIESLTAYVSGLCEYEYSKEYMAQINSYKMYELKETYKGSDIFFVEFGWEQLDAKIFFEYHIYDGDTFKTQVFEINYLKYEVSKATWNDSVYFIMVDRFKADDEQNKISNDDYFCEGTFLDVAKEVERIKEDGYSIVYLSPIMKALSYHGYDQISLNELNSKFGEEKEFKDLIDIIIKNNMKIGLEIVLNHMSVFSESFKQCLRKNNDMFYINDKYEYVKYRESNDFAKIKYTYENIINIFELVKAFLEKYKIKFVRLDCCDYVDPTLIWIFNKWCEDRDIILTGECWQDYENFFNKYPIDGATNYWLYGKLKEMFLDRSCTNEDFQKALIEDLFSKGFEKTGAMLNFIDNHDIERISNIARDESEIKLLLSFIFLYPGIPVVYYGTENYDQDICNIKGNRRGFFKDRLNVGIQTHIRYLNSTRKKFIDNMVYLESKENFFIFARRKADGWIRFIYNNSDNGEFYKEHFVDKYDYFVLEE